MVGLGVTRYKAKIVMYLVGISITSYPLPGLYSTRYVIDNSFCVGDRVGSYPLPGLCRISFYHFFVQEFRWPRTADDIPGVYMIQSALDTVGSFRHKIPAHAH